jgi:hypothetical protein
VKVLGKNVVVFIQVGSDWVLYACATSATLNVVTDMIETSVSGNGRFKSFLPTANSFTGTLEGVTSFETDGKLSLQDLRERQLSQELLMMKYQRSDLAGNLYTDQASFYITSSSDVGSFNDMNNFTVEMQGTGILSLNSSEPVTPVPFTFYYGFTEAETVIDGWVGVLLPTEESLVGSVDDVFTAGTEQSGTEPNTGDDVAVVDFGNTYYKVVFMEYPKTEAKFTKWSEVNNPLQQNQPIDQSFNWGSGAVFFISERGDNWVIISYYQTKFAGKIVFSR